MEPRPGATRSPDLADRIERRPEDTILSGTPMTGAAHETGGGAALRAFAAGPRYFRLSVFSAGRMRMRFYNRRWRKNISKRSQDRSSRR
jgi:hypothetical protein